jgi:hypothetical protein
MGVNQRDESGQTGRERDVDERAFQAWVDSEVGVSGSPAKLHRLPNTSPLFLTVLVAAVALGAVVVVAPFVYGVVKAVDPDRGPNRVHDYPVPVGPTWEAPPTRIEQEAQLELRRSRAAPAQVAIPLVALAVFGLLYLVFGRAPSPERSYEYYREPLDDVAPALVAWLWHDGRVSGTALVATIMDLVDRGVLTAVLEPSDLPDGPSDSCLRFAQGERDSLDHRRLEASALNLMFTVDGRRLSVTTDELRERASRSSRFARAARWWRDDVRYDAIEADLLDVASLRASWAAVGVGVLAMWLSMATYDYYTATRLNPWTLVGIAVGATIVLLARRIVGRTQRAADLHARCVGLHAFLRDFGHLDEYPAYSVAVWRRFLVMAVALGIADETLREFTGKSGVHRGLDDSVAVWEEFEEWSPQAVFDEIF